MRVKGVKNKLAVFVSAIVLAAGISYVSHASVFAEEKSAEEHDPANSWRFKDGKPVKQQEPIGPSISARGGRAVSNAWKNVNGVFLNSLGNPIPNATAKGIDVSKWDGKIDWNKVKADGVDYAILRVGYGENLKSQDDPTWAYNSSECERIGMPYGVYIYSYATNTTKAKSEAEHVIRLVKGKKLSYPIYYDMEDEKFQGGLSNKKLGEIADTFIKTLGSAGYKNVGVYANKYWFTSRLTSSVFDKYPRWVAQYNYRCDYDGTYHMWQSTDSGKITAKGVGKATITAKTSNGKKAVCKVTVRPRTNKIKKLKKSGRKSIKVTWSKVSGTTKYQIYMSKKKSSGYKRVKTASAKTFSFTKKGLKRGKRYYFKIRSYKTVGKTKYYSSYSPIKSIKR